ncbi:UNVERIFIED_CONTAM: hypothetical protein Sradi_3980200 [Sesamum radiatum]|uniref:Transposase n=1 Tax=Sesamum radiatum TaxID=300843 RepID=A0AAW2PHY5_SESRA
MNYSGDDNNEESEFSESEYNVQEDTNDDDVLFDKNIDNDVEWGGPNENNMLENAKSTSESSSETSIEGSGDDFDTGIESKEENRELSFPVFNSNDIYNPSFEIGMVFSTKKEFRDSVHSHAIKTSRNLKITSNDQRRIYAKCGEQGCNWHCHALKIKNEASFQIREYNPNHQCARSYNVKNVNSGWLSKKYIDAFRADPKKNVKGFRNEVIREIRCNVSPFQAYRTKRRAIKEIEGDYDEQYAILWDYANELRTKNPGSTVIMGLSDGTGETKKFDRFYICFKALKEGFLSGCRPIIGVDGCHLKGPHGGILLTAVEIDPNNCLYPIAYAVVGSETKQSWEWFLMLLKEDLHIPRNDIYTFISDKQKGLLPAFENIFPGADDRFCVRHLHGNMKTAGWKGLAYKRALWAAARATTVHEFDKCMTEIGEMDVKCKEWLIEKPAAQWSRSHFNPWPKCDILLNNL